MTMTKILAEAKKDGFRIAVTENVDKFSSNPYYRIVTSREEDGLAVDVEKTASTTWKRKFSEMSKGWEVV